MTAALPNIADLTDPASFAAARRALDAAEQRARADAADAERRAKIEAQQAEEAAFAAEIDSLAGPWEPVETAQAALQNLLDRQAANAAEIRAAEQAVAHASTVLPRLVERAVAGEAVSPDDVATAQAGKIAAEQRLIFLGIVAIRFPPLIAEAEAAIKAAIAAAHQPVYERGVDLRIEAGIAADAAVTSIRRDMDATHAAQKIFDRANALINYAAKRGCIVRAHDGLSLFWPTTERSERRRWYRPAPEVAS